MQLTTNSWWWSGVGVATGLVLGAVASGLTRRFVQRERTLARSWWFGAVLTAAALGLLGWRVGARGELAVYGFVAVFAVPLGVIDWCEHRLPRALVWPQLAGVLAGFVLLCLTRGNADPGMRALGAMFAAAGLFLLLAVVSAGSIGAGDVNVAGIVGAVTGWLGWGQVAGALLLASVFALVAATAAGVRRHGQEDALVVPFGPYLFIGTLVVVLVSV